MEKIDTESDVVASTNVLYEMTSCASGAVWYFNSGDFISEPTYDFENNPPAPYSWLTE